MKEEEKLHLLRPWIFLYSSKPSNVPVFFDAANFPSFFWCLKVSYFLLGLRTSLHSSEPQTLLHPFELSNLPAFSWALISLISYLSVFFWALKLSYIFASFPAFLYNVKNQHIIGHWYSFLWDFFRKVCQFFSHFITRSFFGMSKNLCCD